VDVKDPDAGSLGRPSIESMTASATELQQLVPDGSVPFSIALGELREWLPPAGSLPVESLATTLNKWSVSFAKLGLAGVCRGQTNDDRWMKDWLSVRSCWPQVPHWVAVAYVDSERAGAPAVQQVAEAAIASQCSVLLLDTWRKDSSTLTDWLPISQLRELRILTRRAGLQLALAGRVGPEHIEVLQTCEPDILAVRGSVCTNGDRQQTICERRVRELAALLGTSQSYAVSPAERAAAVGIDRGRLQSQLQAVSPTSEPGGPTEGLPLPSPGLGMEASQ
jgi:uncharacterized protein (UPF0264 family)